MVDIYLNLIPFKLFHSFPEYVVWLLRMSYNSVTHDWVNNWSSPLNTQHHIIRPDREWEDRGEGRRRGGEIQQNTEIFPCFAESRWVTEHFQKCFCASVLHKKLVICVFICAKCITDNSVQKLFSDAPGKRHFLLFCTSQAQLRDKKKDIMHEAEVTTFWGFKHLVWLMNTSFASMLW